MEHFDVYRGSSPVSMVQVGTVSGPAEYAGSGFTDTGLVNGVSYFYGVTANNSIGESNLSEIVTIIPRIAAQPTVANLHPGGSYFEQQLQINWTLEGSTNSVEKLNVYFTHGWTLDSDKILVGSVAPSQAGSTIANLSGIDLHWGFGWIVMETIYLDGNASYSYPVAADLNPRNEGCSADYTLLVIIIAVAVVVTVIGIAVWSSRKGRRG